jgi:PAS domain S-box-containing protein
MNDQLKYENMLKKVRSLEEEVKNYQALIENTPDLFYRTDLQGRITFISPSVSRLSGYTIVEATGMKMAEEIYLVPEERETFLNLLQKEGHVTNFEARLKRKDGSIWWASTNAHFLKNKAGEIIGVEGITRDISDIKAAEKALRESEERFRSAFHTSPDSINLNRVADGLFIDINEGFTKLMGYTKADVNGKSSIHLNIWKNTDDRQRMVDALTKDGFVENLEAEFVTKSGEVKVGLMSARFLRINEEDLILTITRDITEWKKMREMMVQSEKMLSVGGLAAGMAHEINNPLAGILQNASVLANRLTGDLTANHKAAEAAGTRLSAIHKYMQLRKLPEMLENIQSSGRIAAEIVSNMLSFARKSEKMVSSHDIGTLLDQTLDLLKTDYDMKKHYDFKQIRILREYDETVGPIPCEASKLQQVFMNILKNGAEAMAEMKDAAVQPTFVLRVQDDGAWLKVEIEDNGPGMDEKIRRRIFEPFYTTKPMNKGTGLGLSVSYFIVTEDHGGEISVDDARGKGTRFVIRLPKTRDEQKSLPIG